MLKGVNRTKKNRVLYGGIRKKGDTESAKLEITDLDTENYFSKLYSTNKGLNWGLGIEHEMQLFHQGVGVAENNLQNANIIFDSQESSCFLVSNEDAKEPNGACRKMRGWQSKPLYYNPSKKIRDKLLTGKNKLTMAESDFLESIDWELSGRQAKGCIGGSTIIPRVPILMPELVTGKHTNRTIQSIVNEIQILEQVFIKIQMKNPFTREKVKQYGPLVIHHCGTMGNIQVPETPTIHKKEYILTPKKWKDYLGSYHVTFTLPHTKDIDTQQFVKLHERCANQLQWIEPLLVCAFFSPDPDSVGNKRGIEGSFRVVNVGWGNLAGSDVRKFGTEGITRGSSHETKWRKGFNYLGDKRIKECVKTSPAGYKKSHDILTSDFRTFGLKQDLICTEEYARLHPDCPRLDGEIMRPPFGMEFRIFDHFPSKYLLDLMKVIILVASNSNRHPSKKYVYNNPDWIKGIRDIMLHGWNTRVVSGYLNELRKQLGIPIKLEKVDNSKIALDVFKCIVNELWELNKDSPIVSLLDETPDIAPNIPSINKDCWEMNFNIKYLNIIMNQLRKSKNTILKSGVKNVDTKTFKKMLFNNNKIDKKKWEHQIEDILYALQTKKYVELTIKAGNIKTIKILF